jgi:hypothetical protein
MQPLLPSVAIQYQPINQMHQAYADPMKREPMKGEPMKRRRRRQVSKGKATKVDAKQPATKSATAQASPQRKARFINHKQVRQAIHGVVLLKLVLDPARRTVNRIFLRIWRLGACSFCRFCSYLSSVASRKLLLEQGSGF